MALRSLGFGLSVHFIIHLPTNFVNIFCDPRLCHAQYYMESHIKIQEAL